MNVPGPSPEGKSVHTIPSPLRASFWDVAFYSLMVGLGETYIVAFVLALGFSEQASGMLATLPLLIGSIVQLFAGAGIKVLGSHRRWVLICATLQAVFLGSLAILGLLRPNPAGDSVWLVFLLVTLYWTFGMSAGPSWNSWIGSIVPVSSRASFFAIRTRIGQLFTVFGLVITGLWLHYWEAGEWKLQVFAGLFIISALSRLVSVYFLSRHPEGENIRPTTGLRLLLKADGFRWLRERRTSIIILFLLTTHFSINVSGPYFNAYLLKALHLDYLHYMLLISASFVTRVLTGGWLQRLANQHGSTSLAHLGALLIIPTPALWIFGDSFFYMLLLQVYTGLAWGCHELGVTLMLLDKQDHEERARLLTLTTLLNAVAMFAGSTFGYWMLAHEVLLPTHYHHIFAASTLLRIVPFFILPLIGDSHLRLTPWLRSAVGSWFRPSRPN